MALSWQTQPLAEVAHIQTGKLDSNAAVDNGRYPYFTCSPETLRIDEFAFDKEAVLLAGNNANGIFCVKHFKGKFNAYQRTYVIEPKDTKELDARFLYYFITTLSSKLTSYSSGTATKFLTRKILDPLPVPLLDIEIQRQISSVLGSLDDKIELNRKMNETLEEISRAIFKSWFVDFDPVRAKMDGRQPHGMDAETAALFPSEFEDSKLGEIPKGWRLVTVEEFSSRIAMGPFGSRIKTENFVSSGVPVVRGGNLKDGFVDDGFVYVTNEKAQELKSAIARPNDIVFTHRGTLGQVGIIPKAAKFSEYIVSQSQMLMSVDQEKISPYLVYWFFKDFHGKEELLSYTNTTGVPSIGRPSSSLKKIVLPLPPKELSDKFESLTSPWVDLIWSNKRENQILSDIRDSLLPKLLSGEVFTEKLTVSYEQLSSSIVEEAVA